MLSKIFLAFILVLTFLLSTSYFNSAYAQPSLKDPNLKAELLVEGLSSPTSMAFVDSDNILVLEKNSGEVRLISNGVLQEEPLLKLEVDTTTLTCCRGLLGIVTINNEVFLYFSEAAHDDQPVRNRLYKYQWDGNSLINPKLILDLPATPGPNHPGGKIVVGKDHYLYTAIGDLNNERIIYFLF